jgi:hypothetical protein
MADNKTRPTGASVIEFMAAISDPGMRAGAKKVAAMMRRATGKRARMWGPSIVGYGSYQYRDASGREGEFMITGFSPRKQAMTIYIMPGFSRFDTLMSKLGKYKTGKSCLYIRRLADVDETVLEQIIEESVGYMRAHYDTG